MNSSYDIIQKIGGANGLTADLHEFLLTPEGTALMTIYEIVPGDVSMFRQFNPEQNGNDNDPNWIWDGILQEVDLETGECVFEWRASEHVEFTETYRPVYGMGNHVDPFDWFHINSIQKDELGNYLISARYPHSITYIDGKTKETIWQLGGKSNNFMDLSAGNATNFAWQHDARFHPTDTFPNLYTPPPEREGVTTQLLTLFDNAAEDQHYQYGMPLSRGLLLELTYPTPGTEKAAYGSVKGEDSGADLTLRQRDSGLDEEKIMAINGSDPAYTVRVIQSWENPNWVRSSSQGNVQLLLQGPGQDPKVMVGYGLNAVWTEFDANGTVLADVHYGARKSWERGDAQSYRVYKFDWHGAPRWEPNLVINDDDSLLHIQLARRNGSRHLGPPGLPHAQSRRQRLDGTHARAESRLRNAPRRPPGFGREEVSPHRRALRVRGEVTTRCVECGGSGDHGFVFPWDSGDVAARGFALLAVEDCAFRCLWC